jgi:hypothetical protein
LATTLSRENHMGRTLDSRLRKLEQTGRTERTTGMVVIFDPATGQPLTPVDASAIVQVWLPDNGRAASGNVAIAHPLR